MRNSKLNPVLVIYVAGPFRAKPIMGQTQPNQWEQEQNIRRAEAIALDIWRMGHAAVCPHTNTRYYQGAAPDEVWLIGDLAIIEKCDGVLLTPDWERSVGAKNERDHAEALGIPFSTDVNELIDMIKLKQARGDDRVEAKLRFMAEQTVELHKMLGEEREQNAKLREQIGEMAGTIADLHSKDSPQGDPLYGNPR